MARRKTKPASQQDRQRKRMAADLRRGMPKSSRPEQGPGKPTKPTKPKPGWWARRFTPAERAIAEIYLQLDRERRPRSDPAGWRGFAEDPIWRHKLKLLSEPGALGEHQVAVYAAVDRLMRWRKFTIKQAAGILGLPARSMRHIIDKGELPAMQAKKGKQIFIHEKALLAYALNCQK